MARQLGVLVTIVGLALMASLGACSHPMERRGSLPGAASSSTKAASGAVEVSQCVDASAADAAPAEAAAAAPAPATASAPAVVADAGRPQPSVAQPAPPPSPRADERLQRNSRLPAGQTMGLAGLAASQAVRENTLPAARALVPNALMLSAGVADFNTEQYAAIEEQGFFEVANRPLSTFSVDVDTASYANVRRYLTGGMRPPSGAVRIEELINYFSYDYPEPTAGAPFAVTTELAVAPWEPAHQLLLVGLRGRSVSIDHVPPRNLVFLVDVSGSMQPADKLPLVQQGLAALVQQLRPEDHVAIVVYAGASGVLLEPTSGAAKESILAALGGLRAGGGTNGAGGIRAAYELARRNFDSEGINRVILATDGDFNVGVTSQSDLLELIERERESGVFLSVLGVGSGNLKDSTMELLADHGNGNYAYLDSASEARKVLVEQASATLMTIAKDVKIQIEFNPKQVKAYRLIGYENRRLHDKDFNDDKKDAGDVGAGHNVTALYEIVPADAATPAVGVDPLRYQQPGVPTDAALGSEVATVKLRYKEPDGQTSKLLAQAIMDDRHSIEEASTNLRFAAAVATFGMVLRGSDDRGAASYELADSLARGALGDDAHAYRAEFLRVIEMARALG